MVTAQASNPTLKRVCFTLHDYTDEDEQRIQSIGHQYLIYGREQCPTTSRRHLQGFINLLKKQRFNQLKILFGSRAHIEPAKGTDDQNKRYCEKDGDIFTSGEPSKQGSRTDLKTLAEKVREYEGNLFKIATEYPAEYIRYHRGIRAYRDITTPIPKRNFKTEVSYCSVVCSRVRRYAAPRFASLLCYP